LVASAADEPDVLRISRRKRGNSAQVGRERGKDGQRRVSNHWVSGGKAERSLAGENSHDHRPVPGRDRRRPHPFGFTCVAKWGSTVPANRGVCRGQRSYHTNTSTDLTYFGRRAFSCLEDHPSPGRLWLKAVNVQVAQRRARRRSGGNRAMARRRRERTPEEIAAGIKLITDMEEEAQRKARADRQVADLARVTLGPRTMDTAVTRQGSS